MEIKLTQKEISQIIVEHLVEEARIKSESVSIQYDITPGKVGNELSCSIMEN